MANKSGSKGESVPPRSLPETTPENMPKPHDWTLQIVMEMQKTLGGMTARLEDLREAQKDLNKTQGDIEKKLASFDTTLKVGGVLLALFLGLFWFWFGGDIQALRNIAIQEQAAAAAAAAQK